MTSVFQWSRTKDFLKNQKTILLAVIVSLGLGIGCGQMLNSRAESPPVSGKETGKQAGVSIPVHSGKTSIEQSFPEVDSLLNKMRLGLHNSLFEHWRTMEPDAAWMFRDFDRISSHFDRSWPFSADMGTYVPKLDTSEQNNQIKITAEVPGVDEHNLDVTVTDDAVIIKGDKKVETIESPAGQGIRSIERSYGAFERRLALPCKVQSDKARATLKNGVLTITVPKSEVAQVAGKKLTIHRE